MSGSHLWKLLRLKPADGDLWHAYRRVFIETYVRDTNGKEPIFNDWTGRRVKFGPDNFEHAFTRNPGFRQGSNYTVELDPHRAERMLWIREVLGQTAGTLRRYAEQFHEQGRKKRRRVFYVVEEAYVVVLDEPEDGAKPLQFVSAYPTAGRDYEREIKRKGGALMEERRVKPPAEKEKAPVLDGD